MPYIVSEGGAHMKLKKLIFVAIFTLMSSIGVFHTNNPHARAQTPVLIPGAVIGLFHNVNQTNKFWCLQPRSIGTLTLEGGGDLRGRAGEGYFWWMVRDNPGASPGSWRIPSGVVMGLMHSVNQSGRNVTAFGFNAHRGPPNFENLIKCSGGDLGAPSGHGYFWYESTGGYFDPYTVQNLPEGTVIGLKHSINQKGKILFWNGVAYDPANPASPIPPGFRRMYGGDLGGRLGEGYFWFEKVTGPRVLKIDQQACGGRGKEDGFLSDEELKQKFPWLLNK
jgi:hypothetical protein